LPKRGKPRRKPGVRSREATRFKLAPHRFRRGKLFMHIDVLDSAGGSCIEVDCSRIAPHEPFLFLERWILEGLTLADQHSLRSAWVAKRVIEGCWDLGKKHCSEEVRYLWDTKRLFASLHFRKMARAARERVKDLLKLEPTHSRRISGLTSPAYALTGKTFEQGGLGAEHHAKVGRVELARLTTAHAVARQRGEMPTEPGRGVPA